MNALSNLLPSGHVQLSESAAEAVTRLALEAVSQTSLQLGTGSWMSSSSAWPPQQYIRADDVMAVLHAKV